ncbi:TPA_asm: hypothetical protein [Pinus albicaulis amalgavirus 1]|nr:TPA_asm: hypothetical protein [Pinus albicaulis amalgavirus 1]
MALTNIGILRANRVPLVPDFEAQILAEGFMQDKFEKDIGVLAAFGNQKSLAASYAEAGRHGILPLLTDLTPRQVMAWAKWCKGEKGKKAMVVAQRTEKLKRRLVGDMSTQDLAYVSMLDTQLGDYSQDRKDEITKREAKIKKLTLEIERQRVRMQECLDQIAEEYLPASQYVAPTYDEVLRAEWNDWVAAKLADGQPEPARSDANYKACVEETQKSFLTIHKGEFLAVPQRRDVLMKYIQDKISRFRGSFDRRAADNLEVNLVAAGGIAPTAFPPGTQAGGSGGGPSGQGHARSPSPEMPTFTSPLGTQRLEEPTGAGDEDEGGDSPKSPPADPSPKRHKTKPKGKGAKR